MAQGNLDLKDAVREAWATNAGWWDDQIGPDGNEFHRALVAPAQLRQLRLKPGERVLEIACGNGQFAREMAANGAQVVAFDFSKTFIERARRHTEEAGIEGTDFQVIDATDEEQLRSLGAREFDAAVCTMALMDMPTIEPLISALPGLLKPSGRFVFSVQHPCFNSTDSRMVAEQEERDGELVTVFSIKIGSYLHVPSERAIGIVGQPVPHYYFHRTISELLNTCFRHGFVLDGIEEPAHQSERESDSRIRWRNYIQIPPVLVARLRAVN